MRAHLVQLDIAWHDKRANYAATRSLLAGAGVAPGDLIVLPEMFDTGFSLELEKTVDRGETLEFLQELAKEHAALVQGTRSVLGPDGLGRNRASVVDPAGRILAEYDKVHPFSLGKEHERFAPGEGVTTYAWGEAAVCPTICYDLRFPELYRAGMLKGANVFTVVANWPDSRAEHFDALLRARAIENQAYVLGVNRVGTDPNLRYIGGSAAISSKGEVLGKLGDAPGVLSVEIDIDHARRWRAVFPALRDARFLGKYS